MTSHHIMTLRLTLFLIRLFRICSNYLVGLTLEGGPDSCHAALFNTGGDVLSPFVSRKIFNLVKIFRNLADSSVHIITSLAISLIIQETHTLQELPQFNTPLHLMFCEIRTFY